MAGTLWHQCPGLSPAPASSLPDRLLAPPTAGGFATFSSCFPGLCEGKPAALLPVSLSQPCLPVPSVGLTRILPHLYLGSQKDVLNKVCAQAKGDGGSGRRELKADGRMDEHGLGLPEDPRGSRQTRARLGEGPARPGEEVVPCPLSGRAHMPNR